MCPGLLGSQQHIDLHRGLAGVLISDCQASLCPAHHGQGALSLPGGIPGAQFSEESGLVHHHMIFEYRSNDSK